MFINNFYKFLVPLAEFHFQLHNFLTVLGGEGEGSVVASCRSLRIILDLAWRCWRPRGRW